MDPAVPLLPGAWGRDLILRSSDLLQQHLDAEPTRAYLTARGVALDFAAAHYVGVMCPILEGSAPFLAWARRYWSPWGGLVFPLRDALGGLVGLEVRRLPAELEPGQNPYADFQFNRATGQPLAFGLPEALPAIWTSRRVVLVEGVFDYFAARAAGTSVAVANLTANVAAPMRRFLGRYTQVVVALLDMDVTGRAAAASLGAMGASEGFLVVTPSYPAKDPGTLLQQGRTDVLRKILSSYAC